MNDASFSISKDLADDYSNGADLASGTLKAGTSNNGIGQWNQTTWVSHMYKIGETSLSDWSLDTTLGFYRPNCFYLPDQFQAIASYTMVTSNEAKVISIFNSDA